jgi:hypothetical protein
MRKQIRISFKAFLIKQKNKNKNYSLSIPSLTKTLVYLQDWNSSFPFSASFSVYFLPTNTVSKEP